jgi:hypothetical protein
MMGLSFKFLLALASAVILRYDSRRTHDHILLSQIRDSPNMEGQVPVFISPRIRVAQLYYATRRKVAGSIPDEVIEFFN